MSDLPDDVRQWPSDPFVLLGVPRNVPPRELKRAYTRLIRAYKPEHAPEEFRRIREAYDTARQFAELHAAYEQDGLPAAPDIQPGPTLEVEQTPASTGAAEPKNASRVKTLDEQLDECWQAAVEGEEHKAYLRLEQLHAQSPHDDRVKVRLYWLLTVAPQLDPRRSPCDWLVAGLKRSGLRGPLRELYRRELTARPSEALSERCDELLSSLPASSGLAELVEWRWKAAARMGRAPEAIRADLALLRDRFLAHDDEIWARLVMAAVDHAASMDTPEARDLLARCRYDLKGMTHLHLRLSAVFDRVELAEDLAAKSRALLAGDAGHREFVAVVRQAWILPIEELRPRLMAYLAMIAARPEQSLQYFDAVERAAPPLLYQFRRALSLLETISEPPADMRSAEDIEFLVLSFVYETPSGTYNDWRLLLLGFCLREVVVPAQVAAVLDGSPDFQLASEQQLAEAAASDLPLACVCHACRLFWA